MASDSDYYSVQCWCQNACSCSVHLLMLCQRCILSLNQCLLVLSMSRSNSKGHAHTCGCDISNKSPYLHFSRSCQTVHYLMSWNSPFLLRSGSSWSGKPSQSPLIRWGTQCYAVPGEDICNLLSQITRVPCYPGKHC